MIKLLSIKLLTVGILISVLAGCATPSDTTAKQEIPGTNQHFYDDLFNQDFFAGSKDPFQEMARISQQINSVADVSTSLPNFDQWYSQNYGEFPAATIRQDEDAEHFYYRLEVEEEATARLNIKLEGKDLLLKAELTRVTESNSEEITLNQRFPLPINTRIDSIVSWKSGNQLIIRLDKHSI